MGKLKKWAKINPTSFQEFWRDCELRLGAFSWIVSQLYCKWKLECFSVLNPWKCKEIVKIGEILFGGPQTEKQFRGNDFKKVVINSEIFPRKWRNFLVVREPRQNLSSGPRVGKGWEPLLYIACLGSWRLSRRVRCLPSGGSQFESHSSRHVRTLGKSFTHSEALWRINSDTVSMLQSGASLCSCKLEEALYKYSEWILTGGDKISNILLSHYCPF